MELAGKVLFDLFFGGPLQRDWVRPYCCQEVRYSSPRTLLKATGRSRCSAASHPIFRRTFRELFRYRRLLLRGSRAKKRSEHASGGRWGRRVVCWKRALRIRQEICALSFHSVGSSQMFDRASGSNLSGKRQQTQPSSPLHPARADSESQADFFLWIISKYSTRRNLRTRISGSGASGTLARHR